MGKIKVTKPRARAHKIKVYDPSKDFRKVSYYNTIMERFLKEIEDVYLKHRARIATMSGNEFVMLGDLAGLSGSAHAFDQQRKEQLNDKTKH